jgi:hypothetical protein
MGDPIIERAVDYVLADEITHVRMGSKWMRKLTDGDPERLQRGSSSRTTSMRCSISTASALRERMRRKCP